MKIKSEKNSLSRIGFIILTFVAFLSLLLYTISVFSSPFAQFSEKYFAFPIRATVAALSELVPISLVELMLLTLPISLTVFISLTFKIDNRKAVAVPLIIVEILVILYSTTLAIPTLAVEKKSHGVGNLSENAYISSAYLLSDRAAKFSGNTEYSFYEINSLVSRAVLKCADERGLPQMLSTVKESLIPEILTGAGILAHYSFISSEISVNGYQPQYMLAFTIAHEEAHFLGITHEDEANLFAYIALSESENSYLRYSAALRGFEYIASMAYDISSEAYNEAYSLLGDVAHDDLKKSRELSKVLGRGFLGEISKNVNDGAISLRDSRGAESYSGTAALIASYLTSGN